LWIRENANNRSDNSSNLGHAFELPVGMKKNSEEAKSYLAGSQLFKVKELEVF
jgi:hypothetical protein